MCNMCTIFQIFSCSDREGIGGKTYMHSFFPKNKKTKIKKEKTTLYYFVCSGKYMAVFLLIGNRKNISCVDLIWNKYQSAYLDITCITLYKNMHRVFFFNVIRLYTNKMIFFVLYFVYSCVSGWQKFTNNICPWIQECLYVLL